MNIREIEEIAADVAETDVKSNDRINRIELTLKQSESENPADEIDLADLFLKLINGKGIILISIIGAVILSMIIFFVKYVFLQETSGTATTVVNFNFDGIDKGLDPHGNTFDVSEIKKAEIISKTVDEFELEAKGITVEDIRRNIYISGIIPQNVMDRILVINKMAEKDASKLEMLNDIEYFAVQYKIDFNIEKSLGLDKLESVQILRSIIDNYKTYFITKYSDKYVLSTAVTELDMTRYDYSEAVMLAEEQLSAIRNYVARKNNDAPDFRAQNTGMSFNDILSRIDIVRDVDLNRVQSLIYTFNLSKDPVKLIAIYQNRINTMEKQVEQKTGEATNTRQVIENYKKDTSIMMVTGDNGAPVEMTKGSEVYDDLVKQANAAENEAVRLRSEIEYYRTLITRMTGEETVDAATKAKYGREVQTELDSLMNRMSDITTLANDTVDNYFETKVFSTAVKSATEPVYISNFRNYLKSGIMMTAIIVVIAFMLSVMYVLVRDMYKSGKKHAQNNI